MDPGAQPWLREPLPCPCRSPWHSRRGLPVSLYLIFSPLQGEFARIELVCPVGRAPEFPSKPWACMGEVSQSHARVPHSLAEWAGEVQLPSRTADVRAAPSSARSLPSRCPRRSRRARPQWTWMLPRVTSVHVSLRDLQKGGFLSSGRDRGRPSGELAGPRGASAFHRSPGWSGVAFARLPGSEAAALLREATCGGSGTVGFGVSLDRGKQCPPEFTSTWNPGKRPYLEAGPLQMGVVKRS